MPAQAGRAGSARCHGPAHPLAAAEPVGAPTRPTPSRRLLMRSGKSSSPRRVTAGREWCASRSRRRPCVPTPKDQPDAGGEPARSTCPFDMVVHDYVDDSSVRCEWTAAGPDGRTFEAERASSIAQRRLCSAARAGQFREDVKIRQHCYDGGVSRRPVSCKPFTIKGLRPGKHGRPPDLADRPQAPIQPDFVAIGREAGASGCKCLILVCLP